MDNITYNKNLELLKLASNTYYNTDVEIMTDAEYDELFSSVKSYAISNNIPEEFLKNNIGATPNTMLLIKHKKPMFTQKSMYDIKEALAWVSKKRTKAFYLEPKLNGCTINITYINGKLQSIVTRGDGLVGGDVSFLSEHVKGIPKTIKYFEHIEIIGEVVIPNKKYSIDYDISYNPRNLINKLILNKDIDSLEKYDATFIPYGTGYTKLRMNKSELKPFFTTLGFKQMPSTFILSDNVALITKTYNTLIKNQNTILYPIDGMMIYINKHEDQSFYGYSKLFPLYSIALKLPNREYSAYIKDVEFVIDRKGTLSPEANIATLSNESVSLLNMSHVIKNDIRIGDKVIIDIEDKYFVKAPYRTLRDGTEVNIILDKCPHCKSKLLYERGDFKCVNDKCKGILKAKIKFMNSKDSVYTKHLTDDIINKLVDSNKIKHPIDVYTLDIKTLKKAIPESVVPNIVKTTQTYDYIQKAKMKDFYLILESLSIQGLGKATCLNLHNKGINNIKSLLAYVNGKPEKYKNVILQELDSKVIDILKNIEKEKKKKRTYTNYLFR